MPTAQEMQLTRDNPMSRQVTLKTSGNLSLVHRTYGWKTAGAGITIVNDAYGIMTTVDGATHGRWYRTYEEALARFNNITD
jgi:hypothetical protein